MAFPWWFIALTSIMMVMAARDPVNAGEDLKNSKFIPKNKEKGAGYGDGDTYPSPSDGGDSGDGGDGGYGARPPKVTPTYPGDGGEGGTVSLPQPNYGGGSGDGGYGSPSIGLPGHGTCKFWSDNYGSWPNIFSALSSMSSVFENAANLLNSMFGGGMTLMDALQSKGNDPYSNLVREAAASLLNSYAYPKKFPFTPEVVKNKFGAALVSPSAATLQSKEFGQANIKL